MLKVATIPILARIVSKLDLKPVIEKLRALDIFKEANGATEAKSQLTAETMGLVAAEVIAEITPQLGKIADDIPQFVALYKGIDLQEACEVDFFEFISEIKEDRSIINFFSSALRKKVEQQH